MKGQLLFEMMINLAIVLAFAIAMFALSSASIAYGKDFVDLSGNQVNASYAVLHSSVPSGYNIFIIQR